MAADGEREAAVQPERQRDDQAVQRGGRADLRKRRVAEQMARNGGIGEVIDLLKQVTDEERQRKAQQQPGGAAGCHIQRMRAHGEPPEKMLQERRTRDARPYMGWRL